MPESFQLKELPHLGRQDCELRRELDGLRDPPCIVADNFLCGLRLGNRIIPFKFLLERENVVAFVPKSLRSRVRLAFRQRNRLKAQYLQRRNLLRKAVPSHKRRCAWPKPNIECLPLCHRTTGYN